MNTKRIPHMQRKTSKTKRRRRQKRIVAKVRCQGKLHRVVLTWRGHLALEDHPDLYRERVLENLSGKQCRCREVMTLWRNVIAGRLKGRLEPDSRALRDLPRPLRKALFDAAMLHRKRQLTGFVRDRQRGEDE